MNWSMPRPVLQIVAAVIGVAALGSFSIGILTADAPAKLPGERRADGYGQAIEATEATPLAQERIEGPPPPPELTPEEKAKLEAEQKAKEEAARAKAAADAAALPTLTPPPQDQIGAVLEKARPAPPPPPPEEPLF
jgi:hypothetical protein